MGRSTPRPKGRALIPCPVRARGFPQKYGVETPQPSEEGERASPLTLPRGSPHQRSTFHPSKPYPSSSIAGSGAPRATRVPPLPLVCASPPPQEVILFPLEASPTKVGSEASANFVLVELNRRYLPFVLPFFSQGKRK